MRVIIIIVIPVSGDIKKVAKTIPPWREFEELVARIQRDLAPSAEVKQNEWIVGRSGVPRHIDVTVRQSIGAYPVLIAFDCKRHTRKVELNDVAAFADQAKDVGARLGVLISNTGFTRGAHDIAKEHMVTLQTLREAESADWARLLGPGAWTSIMNVAARDVTAVALIQAGQRIAVTLDTPVLDREHHQAETIGQLFWARWKALGVDRPVGRVRFKADAVPGEVFINCGDRFEEVNGFDVNANLVATRWVVPLQLDRGHVLQNISGEPAYQEFTSSSVEWQHVMSTQAGEIISPEEFSRDIKEARQSVDLAKVKRFVRVVIKSRTNPKGKR